MATDIAIQPADRCPVSRDAQHPHTWIPDDGADIIAFGSPDLGISVDLGRCRYCRAALLSIGEHGSEQHQRSLLMEVTGAEVTEQDA
jgi:hypothetical protein